VSIEVEPTLANDTDATIASAKALWASVDRPNVLIKIPATLEGLPAITACIAEGISVNVTLIFSTERYREVMDAYLAGLEQAKDNGVDLSKIRSVASFFVSRVDTEIDKRLEKIGSDEALGLRGKAAVANARIAYGAFEEVFGSERWKGLAGAGAHVQRPLWASTGVKNPAYPDTLYVTDLVVADTVNTMPEKTLDAFADHGEVSGDQVTGKVDEAQALFDQLSEVGVDLDDVFLTLESEGVDKFKASWTELVDTVKGQMERV
jgi:transaldolase